MRELLGTSMSRTGSAWTTIEVRTGISTEIDLKLLPPDVELGRHHHLLRS